MKLVRFHIFVFSVFLALNFSMLAMAQSVSDYVSETDPAPWVDIDPVGQDDFPLAKGLQVGYQLVSYQSKILPDNKMRYQRFVIDMQTKGGVEDNGTLTLTFDPTYQTVDFHTLTIIRNGKPIDLLDLDKFDIYRVETDREKLLYNGDLQIGFAIPGLQVGDRLDYSYTIKGINSALAGSYYDRQSFTYNVPVRKLRNRLVIDSTLEVFTKAHNNPPEPKKSKNDKFTVLDWTLTDIDAQPVDDDRPAWYYSRPVFETSGVDDWSEVGAHFSQYYETPEQLSPELEAIVSEIASGSEKQKIRARKALGYVQSNVRYLGIELGESGFIPRDPNLVFQRRFGDCKDVTYLLLSLLHRLGVKAEPVLVNTDERGNFVKALPGYTAFDHVLVRAEIEGKSYFLDATRGEQLGDLDHLDQGSFQKGLLLAGAESRVLEAAQTDIEWRKDFIDEYDLVSDPDNINFTTTASYFGQNADWMKAYVESNGMVAIEKEFLDYYADFYPSIQVLTPTEIEVDKTTSKYQIKSYYIIKDAWEHEAGETSKTFSVIPYEVSADMPQFSGAKRSAPFSLAFPKKIRQRLRFKVEDDWSFDLDPTTIENDYFEYERVHRFENSLYEESYSYQTKQDNLPADNFSDIMKEIEAARDDFGVTMSVPTAVKTASGWQSWSEKTWGLITVGLLLGAGFLASIGLIFNRDYDLAWRDQVTFHPVSVKKFVFLSFLTLGHYQIYWFYKNWQWVKTVLNEDIWPAPRALFSGFMNFSLFPRIEEIGPVRDKKGYGWYGVLAFPLALLYFLSGIYGSAVNRIDSLPDWAGVIGLALLLLAVPVLLQINKYNEDRPDLIAKHSRFSIFTWGLVLIYAPIAILVYYGVAIILFELI